MGRLLNQVSSSIGCARVVRSGSRCVPLKLIACLRSFSVGTSKVTSVPGHPRTLAHPSLGGPTADPLPISAERPFSSYSGSTSSSKPRSAAMSVGVHDVSVSLHTNLCGVCRTGPECTISTRVTLASLVSYTSDATIYCYENEITAPPSGIGCGLL